jgi:hypothetical protein
MEREEREGVREVAIDTVCAFVCFSHCFSHSSVSSFSAYLCLSIVDVRRVALV